LASKADFIEDIVKKLKENEKELASKADFIEDIVKKLKENEKELASKADFIEDIVKKLKENKKELASKEKQIADRCSIHDEQKLFFCQTCEETKCRKCQKTCCVNVKAKVLIEDAKEKVDHLWCRAKAKFEQLQTSREAIPQFQEGVSEIRRESEKIIQKAVDSMRKRVDVKLKIQESKAAKLNADLDNFERDNEAERGEVEFAHRSELLNRMVEKRSTIARISHEADILLKKLSDTDLKVPDVDLEQLLGFTLRDEEDEDEGQGEEENEGEEEGEEKHEEEVMEKESEVGNVGQHVRGQSAKDGDLTDVPETSSSASARMRIHLKRRKEEEKGERKGKKKRREEKK